MSKIHWSNQVSADFNTAADWSTGTVPGAADDAILDASGKTAYTVTASTSETVKSIQTASTATLSITGGTFTASAGTGSGANAGTILIGNNTIFSVGGALANSGAINLNSGGNTTELFLAADTTLSGAGKVTLSDISTNFILGATATTKLTNVDNTISGAGQLGAGQMTLVNQAAGVINATGANALILNTGAQTVVNAGLLEASGAGGLTISGTTVDDSTGGVIQANTGSAVNLLGADIVGGTFKTVGTGVIETGANDRASLIDGTTSTVNNTGALNVTNNAWLTVEGVIANTATISVNSAGNDTRLIVAAAGATLKGGGKLTLSDSTANTVVGATAAATLTNVDNLISGAGQFGGGQMTFVNQKSGIVNATGANVLVLNTAGQTVTNAGLLEATGAGGLTISGTTVNSSTGGSIQANTGSAVNLVGADIVGGTLATVGTGVIETGPNDRASQLDGTAFTVNNTGQLNVTNNAWLTISGAIANGKAGVIALNSAGNDTRLIVGAANATITGGVVILSDSAANTLQGTVSGPAGSQVASTLTNKTTISGAGQIGGVSMTLVNTKTIDATGANALIINVGGGNFASSSTVSNTGLLEATNPNALATTGGLDLRSITVANGAVGIVEANGAATHVDLDSVTIQGGTLKAINGGVIQTAASNRASLIDGSAGAVTLTGPLNITNNAYLTLKGTINNTGTVSLLSVGNDTRLFADAAGLTLIGGGKITLTDSTANTIQGATAATVLTNVDNTISGAGSIGAASLTLINQAKGVINANGTNALILNTSGNTVTNAGLIEATGSAGLLIQNTTVNDTSGGTLLAATGSVITLSAADIIGGPLSAQGTGFFQTAASDRASLIDGSTSTVTNNGLLKITNNAYLTLKGTINNTGTVSLLSIGNDTRLFADAAGLTLIGGGQVTLTDSTANTVQGAAAATVLTNVDNTISGAGSIGAASLTLINQAKGVINANGTNGMTLNSGASVVTNTGLIEATGTGGLLIQNTTVNGSSGGVILAANGSSVTVQGADIVGGTLQTQGTGVFQTAASDRGSLLDGATFTVNNAATFNITNNAYLTIQGAIDNTGSINLNSVGNDTRLRLGANTTLTGNGVIVLNGNAANTFDAVTAGTVLTNNGNTLEGSGNLIGANITLINNAGGVVNGNQAAALVLSTPGRTITNAGTLEGTGAGGLTISGSVVNGTGGTVFAGAGSNVTLTASTLTGGAFSTAATGQIVIGDGSTATIDSVAGNGGTILVNGNKSTTSLIFAANTSLTGGGVLELSDSKKNVVKGTKASIVLTNVDNTIEGSGKLGSKRLTLVNGAGGVIDGDNHNPLTIDTGSVAVSNAGLIETTASGKLTIKSGLSNTGLLEANTGNLTVDGAVTGGGSAQINGGNLAFGASFTENVAFTGTSGKLILAQSQGYGGQVSGFSHKGRTSFDLQDITFGGSTSASYSGTATSGILTVTDGTHTAHITLIGDYTTATFNVADDGAGGTSVTDPTAPSAPAAVPAAASAQNHQFIAAMASLGGDPGGPVSMWTEGHGGANRQNLFTPRSHAA